MIHPLVDRQIEETHARLSKIWPGYTKRDAALGVAVCEAKRLAPKVIAGPEFFQAMIAGEPAGPERAVSADAANDLRLAQLSRVQ